MKTMLKWKHVYIQGRTHLYFQCLNTGLVEFKSTLSEHGVSGVQVYFIPMSEHWVSGVQVYFIPMSRLY